MYSYPNTVLGQALFLSDQDKVQVDVHTGKVVSHYPEKDLIFFQLEDIPDAMRVISTKRLSLYPPDLILKNGDKIKFTCQNGEIVGIEKSNH